MTTAFSPLIGLALPVEGELDGQWGDVVNNATTSYLDIAIAGTQVLSTNADATLIQTFGTDLLTNIGATTAQYAIIRWTASNGATTRNINVPNSSKTYVVINAGTGSVVLRGVTGPTTGITIVAGEKCVAAWNGSDFVKIASSVVTPAGSTTQVQYNNAGLLAASANLTFDGSNLQVGNQGDLRFGDADNSNWVAFQAPATVASNVTWTLPSTDGSINQVLQTSGTGTLSWGTPASSIIAGSASGALSAGTLVALNPDSSVSPISTTNTTYGAVANAYNATQVTKGIAYDTVNQKFVLAVANPLFVNTASVIVGTVLGTNITWGTTVSVLASGFQTGMGIAYDVASGKMVIAYSENSGKYAVVGTVSGTTVTLGTPVLIEAGTCTNVVVTYDAVNAKTVVTINTSGGAKCYVGTVSGTSISFGVANFINALSNSTIVATYTTAGKTVFAYNNGGTTEAVIGTVSGTIMTFGTAVATGVGNPTLGSGGLAIVYDSATARVVIAVYYSPSNFAVPLSISGTNLVAGASIIFAATGGGFLNASYNPDGARIMLAYKTSGTGDAKLIVAQIYGGVLTLGAESNLSGGVAVGAPSGYQPVLVMGYDSTTRQTVAAYYVNSGGATATVVTSSKATTLTVGNYVGASTAVYADGATANITISSGTNTSQTGLFAGTDYYVSTAGALSTTAGSPYVFAGTALSSTNLLIGDSVNVPTTTATTYTATQTFAGSSSALAMILNDVAEIVTVSATAATGTINYDVTTQSVLYYTTNASGNWTVNFRASSGTTLDAIMSTGQSVTAAFLVTQGATAYYNSAVTIDGVSFTPKYQGGTAPTAGNINSIDSYVYTIIKTGSATFTVLASQTQFK
jgi:hypothetical protein